MEFEWKNVGEQQKQWRRDIALLELYRLFRASWLRQGDLTRKEDRDAERDTMIRLSDTIRMLEK